MCLADSFHDKNIEKLYTKTNVIFNTTKSWFGNNLLKLNLNKTKHNVFNLQNIDIQNNLKICQHLSRCLMKNNLNCTCIRTENVSCITIPLLTRF